MGFIESEPIAIILYLPIPDIKINIIMIINIINMRKIFPLLFFISFLSLYLTIVLIFIYKKYGSSIPKTEFI